MGNGKYDSDSGRYLDNRDVENDSLNGRLTQSSLNPGTYYDGDGNRYDENYNSID